MSFSFLPVTTRLAHTKTTATTKNNAKNIWSHYRGTRNIRPRSSSSSSSSVLLFLKKGDPVELKKDGRKGIITEKRGSGWYAIQIVDNTATTTNSDNGTGNDIVKCRSSEITPLLLTKNAPIDIIPNIPKNVEEEQHADLLLENNNESSSNTNTIPQQKTTPPPYIIDLDKAMQSSSSTQPINIKVQNPIDDTYLKQCLHHSKMEKWITFTDLHVCTATLPTCLQVLRKVHAIASSSQKTGILFLGDFWHHRGTIRVDCLNSILEEFSTWDCPFILIPGNHDQVTWTGESHGLTPLQNAYRIKNSAIPGPLIFTHPTIFNGALFVPHIREVGTLESIVQSQASHNSKALFIHADVTGAYMNDMMQSSGGISPKHFPKEKLIYSGHFHKPHVVASKDIEIDYIGSPYETSLSEAGQAKSLYVLDKDWRCIEKIPLDIGKKHFRYTSMNHFLDDVSSKENVKDGDRVVITLNNQELFKIRNDSTSTSTSSSNPLDEKVDMLRKKGVQVEIREIQNTPECREATPNNTENEDLTPQATLASFLSSEVLQRKSLDVGIASKLEKEGLKLVEEILTDKKDDTVSSSSLIRNATDFVLESVSLQGFGSFQKEVTYPLCNRGLVLLRGVNRESGFDSNGSGKSTLVVSILWAISGTIDPRPLDDAKVSDVINDYCKIAKVTLRGTINNKEFIINRSKSSSKSLLTFHYDNDDLTRQSARETQQAINEKLGGLDNTQILSRTFFHGQHQMNGLLEATDVKLKDELSKIVPISLWQECATLARKKSRSFAKQINEVSGMLSIREGDEHVLRMKCKNAEDNFKSKRDALQTLELDTKSHLEKLTLLIDDESKIHDDLQSCQALMNDVNLKVIHLEQQKEKSHEEKNEEHQLGILQEDLEKNVAIFNKIERDILICENDLNRAMTRVTKTTDYYDTILSKWGVVGTNDPTTAVVEENKIQMPSICPTCNQNIDPMNKEDDTDNHSSYHAMQTSIKKDIASANESVQDAMLEKDRLIHTLDTLRSKWNTTQPIVNDIEGNIKELETSWNDQIVLLDSQIAQLRNVLQTKTTEMSLLARQVQNLSEYRSQKSNAESAIQRKRDDVSSAQSSYTSLHQELDTIHKSINELKVEKDTANKQASIMTTLSDTLGARGIQSYILQNAVISLQVSSQSYLDILSDSAQKLELQLDASDRISRIASLRGPKGDGWITRPLSSLSGGQWRRCSLSFQLGFADMVAKRGRFTSSLLVLDEPLTHLDTAGRAYVGQVLKRFLVQQQESTSSALKFSTIIVILQDLVAQELEEIFDSVDEVVKSDGTSIVNVDAGDSL